MNTKKNFYKNASYSALIFMMLMAIYYFISLTASFIFRAVNNDVLIYTISSFFSVIAVAICIILYGYVKEEKPLKVINANKFKPVYLLPALTIFIGMFLGFGFINGLIAEIIQNLGGIVSQANIPLNNAWQLILFTVCYAILPAIFEEIFFRGIMLNGLKEVKKVYAVLITALCFALYHGSLTQLVYQFIYGVALAFLTLKSKSVIPAILVHFLNNFTVLFLQYINASINLLNPILIVIGLIFLSFGFSFLFVYDKSTEDIEKTERVKDFFFPFGITIITVCSIICILSAVSL